ncbi:hypothetical protein [Streptomyces sp. NPDC002088]
MKLQKRADISHCAADGQGSVVEELAEKLLRSDFPQVEDGDLDNPTA